MDTEIVTKREINIQTNTEAKKGDEIDKWANSRQTDRQRVSVYPGTMNGKSFLPT